MHDSLWLVHSFVLLVLAYFDLFVAVCLLVWIDLVVAYSRGVLRLGAGVCFAGCLLLVVYCFVLRFMVVGFVDGVVLFELLFVS